MRPRGPQRVMLYAHDTYGLGHLRRNLAIAGELLERRPGLRVVLASGSPVISSFRLPRGLSVVPLPAVQKIGAEEYRPLDDRLDIDLVRRARSAVIADVARRFRPDVLLVDHAPQGMGGELLPVFEELRCRCPETQIVLGLRDVLDDPATVRELWREQGVYETLETVFDRILVYGSAELFDVRREYAMPPEVAARIRFCGYLHRDPPTGSAAGGIGAEGPFLLGTAGGGGDGSAILSATLVASRKLGLASVLVTGPLMRSVERRRLAERAAGIPGASVVEFVPELAGVMARASAVVTMGGYNTLCELVGLGVPTVVVPRITPRREQAIRAELFARRGLVRMVLPGAALAERLTGVVAEAIAMPAPSRAPLDLGGLARLGEMLGINSDAVDARSDVAVPGWARQAQSDRAQVSA